ncbi:pteridine reductase [Pseudoxanthomonas kalamensis DSM 18571]|uniref:pteridine reductase n=1 Tax=Pseudoxanthomonas kalamensis TaxID=289483 RepID=UPI0013912717|nr:pteridine reductase [Pseudoxanthomonas kalamensis]KAF1712143.1 pteridine reductase [Pseudoxanthomonas kalamensis DSM 18571]
MNPQRRIALVTGGARRIGAAIARQLHAQGYDLALHYRHSAQDARALAAELEAARADSVLLLQADLDAFDRLPELVAATVGRYGRLDALVNNASAYYATPFGQAAPQQWDELFASNARAPFFLSQAAAPHLRASRGAIVSITDIHAERPLPNHSIYCMAKAALVMMTKSLARELAPDVRVNAVAPGNILWSDNPVKAETAEVLRQRVPLQRQGQPEDIASAVLWLLQGNDYVTGQVLAVDGGRSVFM